MKLTSSTITTASISTPTNSLTDVATALGWSCSCTSSMPAGKVFSMRSVVSRSDLPKAMMSPPLAIEMPSAITCLPWCRTLMLAGST